ncbi:extracellular solute-binding protein [Paenibacillus aceti]|uniref:ABC transporter peptide-binding protein YtcQ n=1 Tax=Paenibacillus aceti TaxID=1820010 RepID=A0ABQ1W7A7_9BACL|nr:extracellular solute-binding protein [Paenibacillus aceti]GGG15004.1 putative ABC transporter peptide-binding protein YtcQ [Paenibacillus aceti]
MGKYIKVLLSLTLVLTMVACGSNNSGSNGNAAGNNSQQGANNAADGGKKYTVTWMSGTWKDPVPPVTGDGVTAINEKFNIDFKPQMLPWDVYTEKLAVKIASGDIPDVISIEDADSNFVKWAKQGAFLPLDEFIGDYETFKPVDDFIWDAMKVEGKIYAIPTFFETKGGKKPMIRKDWLDKLGLQMPTSYEELKEVAVAFAKQDPDGDGMNNTTGLGLSKEIFYDPSFSAYYDAETWYHKNDSGQYIPGYISQGNKDKIQFLADLYKEGGLNKDWPIITYNDVFKGFNAGKVGIWYQQPGGVGIDLEILKELEPNAEVVPIPAFKAPDGSQGFTHGSGFYGMYLLNAKLKGEPEKVKRILEMIDYSRQYVPLEERNPQNEYFDWIKGHEGKGYNMVDGVVVDDPQNFALVAPAAYIPDVAWTSNEQTLKDYIALAKPAYKEQDQAFYDMLSAAEFYVNPIHRVHPPKFMEKKTELFKYITDETTKMIVGQRPISEWEAMVQEYMDKGGKEVIDEVNQELQAGNIQGEWSK